jgi:hypothetical protein
MNLYDEAMNIAKEAMENAEGCFDTAQDCIHEICDGHEISIYYHKAIQFCADHPTHRGEEWLEDCGGISQEGDSFGTIACRIAFATLLVAAQDALCELQDELEDAA